MFALKIFKMHSHYFVTRRIRRCIRIASPTSSRCIGDVFAKFDLNVIVTYYHIANAVRERHRYTVKLRQDIGKASTRRPTARFISGLYWDCIAKMSPRHRRDVGRASPMVSRYFQDLFLQKHIVSASRKCQCFHWIFVNLLAILLNPF